MTSNLIRMEPPRHSPKVQLHDVLQRFAMDARNLADARKSLPSDPAARLTAILQEIDETVLPKCISILSQNEVAGELTVANRRLLRIRVHPQPTCAADPAQGNLAEISGMLLKLAGIGESMSVASDRGLQSRSEENAGVSVAALKAEFEKANQHCDVAVFSEILRPVAIACLSWENDLDISGFTGAQQYRDDLENHARQLIRSLDARHRISHLKRRADGFAMPTGADDLIVSVWNGQNGVAGYVARDAGFQVINDWQLRVARSQAL